MKGGGGGGGAGGIAGEAVEAPNMKGAGGGAGGIAGEAFEAPNINGAPLGSCILLGSVSCDAIEFSSFFGSRFSVGGVGRRAVRAQVGLI